MVDLTFHHVGVGVLDMEAAISLYQTLGHRLHLSIEDPGINIRVAFLSCPGPGPWIELLAPLNPGGPLASLIKRRLLPSPYHTCYGVSDIDAAGESLREQGFMQLGATQPAVAFGGAQVAFHLHELIGVIELVERPPAWPKD
jgi:methylmalonyl-CoA/ethylmalonyl-CoA epimerase